MPSAEPSRGRVPSRMWDARVIQLHDKSGFPGSYVRSCIFLQTSTSYECIIDEKTKIARVSATRATGALGSKTCKR